MAASGQAFDNEKYLTEQTKAIRERMEQFAGKKLYLEFGGKLTYDYHAARILPGYDPNVKIRLLQQFADQVEVIVCIYAGDIESQKMRGDLGITYADDVVKIIEDLKDIWGIFVRAVVINRFNDQPAVIHFRTTLEARGLKVYCHRAIPGYPRDLEKIVSDEGFGINEPVATERPIVVVTAPGPGSGKLFTCFSQLYHDHHRGIKSGYAKFETFPIWNLPLEHPINLAYEAATAELADVNLIDHFHVAAYGESSVNYNRDLDAFPLLSQIIAKITGETCWYKSPTDMGVNRAGFGIVDDEACREASKQEIIRRYYRYSIEHLRGVVSADAVDILVKLMAKVGVDPFQRRVAKATHDLVQAHQLVSPAREGQIFVAAAIELRDGTIITAKNSPILHASAALVLNAIKHLAGIPKEVDLLQPTIFDALRHLKQDILHRSSPNLDVEETLIALSVSAVLKPDVEHAIVKLRELRGLEMHLSHLPTKGDEEGLRRLGIHLTASPCFATKKLSYI